MKTLGAGILTIALVCLAGAEHPAPVPVLLPAPEPTLYRAADPYLRTELKFTFDPPSSAVGDEPSTVFLHGTSAGAFTRGWAWKEGAAVTPVDPAGLRREGDTLRGEVKWAVFGVASGKWQSVIGALGLGAEVRGTLLRRSANQGPPDPNSFPRRAAGCSASNWRRGPSSP